jgi:hypothetical protein
MIERTLIPLALLITPVLGQYAGAPYSATETTKTARTLADGTHITQPERRRFLFRDSRGRTRNEVFPVVPNGSKTPMVAVFINIMDPVAGFRYMLDTEAKTAIRAPTRAAVPVGSPPGGTTITPAPRPVTVRRPQSKSESIGTQVMEGLLCDGHRTITTYPAGVSGNDRDIVTTMESWVSQELHIVVVNSTSDPRSGDSVTKLTNISRSEQDPALFVIPGDYTIRDQPLPNAAQ